MIDRLYSLGNFRGADSTCQELLDLDESDEEDDEDEDSTPPVVAVVT